MLTPQDQGVCLSAKTAAKKGDSHPPPGVVTLSDSWVNACTASRRSCEW